MNQEMIYELFEEAIASKNKREKIKLLKQVLDLDPAFSDAQLILTDLTAKDAYDVLRDIEDALEIAAEKLLEIDVDFDEDRGDFYTIMETRPYMRLLHRRFNALLEVGYRLEAMANAEHMLELNSNDNMGIRYQLFSLISSSVPLAQATEIRERWQSEDALEFDLGLLQAAYLSESPELAKLKLNKIIIDYPYFLEGLDRFVDIDHQLPGYEYESPDHVTYFLQSVMNIYNPQFLMWMYKSAGIMEETTVLKS